MRIPLTARQQAQLASLDAVIVAKRRESAAYVQAVLDGHDDADAYTWALKDGVLVGTPKTPAP